MNLQEELDSLHCRIGDNEPNWEKLMPRIKEIENLLKPKNLPRNFETWCEDENIESQHESLCQEYGDSASLLSDYKQYHYENYLRKLEKGLIYY